jgi:hypothetical protein
MTRINASSSVLNLFDCGYAFFYVVEAPFSQNWNSTLGQLATRICDVS